MFDSTLTGAATNLGGAKSSAMASRLISWGAE